MSVIITLQAVQFCFDWIVATVVAVQWCYTFKLGFPQYSETILGWSLYTLFLLLFLPFLKSVLLQRLESDDKKDSTITLQGWRYLMSITCGQAFSTAMSGLAALMFPFLSVDPNYSAGPTGFFLACSITFSFMLLHSCIEWVYHVGLPSYSENGWLKSVLTLLLCSCWNTLGFIWNGVLDKELTLMDEYAGTTYAALFMNGTDPSVPISLRTQPQSLGLQPDPAAGFQTITDLMSGGRPSVDGAVNAVEWKAYKAAIAALVAVITLYLMPDPPPVDDRRWLTRRLRLSAQMITLTVASFATTDVGYYFGMELVTAYTGSEALGLAAAYAYAVLLSCIVCAGSCVLRFRTQTPFRKWLFLLACYDVSYAWWYVWQEMLYETQGWGLTFIEGKWYSDWVDFGLAILENVMLTMLWVFCVKYVSRFAVRKAREAGSGGDEELTPRDVGSITDSFRFLAACSGLDLGSARALPQQDATRYGTDAGGNGGGGSADAA